MFSHMFQRSAVQTSHDLGHSPSTGSLRVPACPQFRDYFAAQNDIEERVVVLRSLIEEFGGEVVASTLGRRLAPLARWKEADSDLWMRKILGELEHCGAVALEDMNGTDVIARVQPVGVTLAYDQPAPSHAEVRSATS